VIKPQTGQPRFDFHGGKGKGFLSSPWSLDWLEGLFSGYQDLSQGLKWLGHEANHSSPSATEVKDAWNYTSAPPYVFMAWCSIKKKCLYR